jgi:hypothetical protein
MTKSPLRMYGPSRYGVIVTDTAGLGTEKGWSSKDESPFMACKIGRQVHEQLDHRVTPLWTT